MNTNKALLTIGLFLSVSFSALAEDSDEIQTIAKFTHNMKQESGFYNFYYQQETDKIFLKISDFNKPFLFQSSMPQGIGSNDIGLDRGQLGDTRLVQFERYGNKVMLKQLNTEFRASSTNQAELASIDEAFADSVIAGLPVVATSKDEVLVDYTDFLLSDIHRVAASLAKDKHGKFEIDPARSGVFLARSKGFPNNTEFEALVTFSGSDAGKYVKQVTPDPTSISVHLHHSLVELPDAQYQPRRFVPFSGFWSVEYQDYSAAIDANMRRQFIPRHRLEKKDPNAISSEAIEPIVYYLDPGIPEPVMSALKDGALWWNQAFSEAGYQNAFQVKVLPEDADPMDVRYNVIQWVHRATRGWSYGSSVIDPRTGEIIKGHVTLGSLRVRQDYLIALGLSSPFNGNESVDTSPQKEMALARIRQLSAHEVGHTLGIAHNFAASEYNRESVMDYPHPYVTLKQGGISLENAYDVGIGEWDKYVIAYGYQSYTSKEAESKGLTDLVSQAREKGFKYVSDPDARAANSANAEGHLWDNGSDPINELKRISDVRKTALANFGVKSLQHGAAFSSLEETLAPIYLLHRYQLDAVAKLIGGVHYEYELKGDYTAPHGVKPVPEALQNEAIDALLETLSSEFLAIPESVTKVITPKAYGSSRNRESFMGRTGVTFDAITAAEASAGYTLSLMLVAERLNRKAEQKSGLGYLFSQLFKQTIQGKREEGHHQLIDRINYLVLDQVIKALAQENLAPEVRGDIETQVAVLHKWLKSKRGNTHNAVMARQLDQYWRTGEWKTSFKVKPLPPGSPI